MKPKKELPSRRDDRWSRRAFLRAGALGAASAVAPASVATAGAGPGFGRARSCLLIFLAGGPSHIDTLDPKPDAPVEVRGAFDPIATRVPGLLLCEHLPQLARVADRLTVVRSMTHDATHHAEATYTMLTGRRYPRDAGQAEFPSRDDHPHLGAALAAVSATAAVPAFAVVPDFLESRGPVRAGQHAGRLGAEFDPFVLAREPHASATGHLRRAMRLHTEPASQRARYGPDRFGQSVLLGRKLIEAGVRFVQVNWVRDSAGAWDTHAQLLPTLRDELLPRADRALAALLEDMAASGLLDETLVVVVGEFGRHPRVSRWSGGREHWPAVFSVLLAGAGMPGGQVFGASDRDGAYPRDCPVTPGELIATIAHALGTVAETAISTDSACDRICEARPRLDLWSISARV